MEFEHFVNAQAGVYSRVLRELGAGRKESHWMWFIFPQLQGLGRSSMAARFALDDVEQARRYLEHEILGPRLQECTQLVLDVQGRSAAEIFGSLDGMKFHSSMTLFALASSPGSVFEQALEKYFGGKKDGNTLRLLEEAGPVSFP